VQRAFRFSEQLPTRLRSTILCIVAIRLLHEQGFGGGGRSCARRLFAAYSSHVATAFNASVRRPFNDLRSQPFIDKPLECRPEFDWIRAASSRTLAGGGRGRVAGAAGATAAGNAEAQAVRIVVETNGQLEVAAAPATAIATRIEAGVAAGMTTGVGARYSRCRRCSRASRRHQMLQEMR